MTGRRAFYSALRPPTDQTAWQWAEENIVFGARQPTARQGKYKSDFTPFVRPILDRLTHGSKPIVVWKSPAQVSKTTTGFVWKTYCIKNRPGPMLVVLSTKDIAEDTAEERFIPMIEDSPALMAEVSKADKYPLRKDKQKFVHMSIDWIGPNSVADATSRPKKYVMLDEVNKYKESLKDEGALIEMLLNRMTTFPGSRAFLASTPTTPDGQISVWYEKSDKGKWMYKCPHCSLLQFPSFEQLKWKINGQVKAANVECWYECQNGCRIDHADRWKLLETSELVITEPNPKDDNVAGVWIHGLSSPFRDWPDFIVKFLSVKDDPLPLQNFVNEWLGEDFIEKRVAVADNQLAARELDYAHGTDPVDLPAIKEVVGAGRSILVCSIDVQKDHFWAMVKRYWEGGHSALVSFARMFSEDDIKTMLATVGTSSDEVWCGIDTGHKAKSHNPDDRDDSAIYDMCLRNGWIATKGASGRMGMPFTITQINPFSGTAKANDGQELDLVLIDTHNIKSLLCQRQVGEGWGKWWIPKDAPNDYRLQVAAEQFNEAKSEWELRPGRRHNHATDCEIIADVVARIAQVNQPKLLQTR